ncbi:MAG: D-alanyl-D-alanine carboxypeptidase [Chloroflexi bacterium]|nr:D-alanyl-D-alanine carboxypeptidase [Chloroflexota bacterium]MCL5075900.1 D-alanyl-D-alanine carboxypeptidase [Chloroflexota bacterium]
MRKGFFAGIVVLILLANWFWRPPLFGLGGGQSATMPTPTPQPQPTPTATREPNPIPPPIRKVGTNGPPTISAQGVAIIDETSGRLLYGKEPHQRFAPASLTKIVTAIIALEQGRLSAKVPIDVDCDELDDSTIMGLKPGEELTLQDLLYGLLLPSGNDAALAIARYIGGSESRFVELMNQKVTQLGLTDSHFANPHGLDAAGHYSSAYDMAMLARYAMQDPTFARIVATKEWTAKGHKTYWLRNLNRLLWYYPGADGVKVGYTDEAGKTMVASAMRNGHRLYVALMKSTDILSDSIALLNYVFENFAWPPTGVPQ